MSQLQNNANLNAGNAISMNPAIIIGAGNQNLQAHPQIGQLNATTMIQLPTSLNPVPSIASNTSNIITSTNPNNTTTFILNPSTNAVQSMQQQPQVHPPTAQLINTSQINQMIASSPLIAAQPQTPQQQIQQFQLQSQQPQVKREEQMLNGSRVANGHDISNLSPVTNGIGDKAQTKVTQNIQPIVVLDKKRLQELVKEVDPNEQLEEEVEDVLLSIADEFIDSLVCTSCTIAKHRKSSTLEVKDVQLALEKNWNMWIPGFGVDGVVGVLSGTAGGGQGSGAAALSKPKKCLATEAHKQRMALIKKTIKKF